MDFEGPRESDEPATAGGGAQEEASGSGETSALAGPAYQDSGSKTADKEIDLTVRLLDDTLLLIFRMLSNNELVTAGQVCRRWRRLAQCPALWAGRSLKVLERPSWLEVCQVVRVLRFAPRLAEFDCAPALSYNPFLEKHFHFNSLDKELLSTQIRSLRICEPTIDFMELYAGSVEELSLTADCTSVLKFIAIKCDSLRKLSLRYEFPWFPAHEDTELILAVVEKHRIVLHSLFFSWSLPDLWDLTTRLVRVSATRLVRASARCPNLRSLGEVPHRDLHLVSALQLEHLELLLEDFELGNLSLPSSLRKLTISCISLRCPLEERIVHALAQVCADLPALEEVAVVVLRLSELGEPCDRGLRLKAAMRRGVEVLYECF